MDKSKQYIEMCDCKEVQSQWKVKQFDVTEDGHVVSLLNEKEKIIESISEDGVGHCGATEDFIWLPRQDQIQEMMPQKMPGNLGMADCAKEWWAEEQHMFVFNLMNGLYKFFNGDNTIANSVKILGYNNKSGFSFEQLWLAFYMHEKHNKKWNGEEWIDAKS